MKKVPKILLSTLLVLAVGMIFSSPAMAAYRIGVLAKRSADKTMTQWGSTGIYLTKKMSTEITIVPLKFTEIEPAIKAKKIDFILANPSLYTLMNVEYGVKAILTMMNERMGVSLHRFGGVLFSKRDSGITSIQQMKGKRFMCVKYSSFGGGQMAWRLLLQNNINPKIDLADFTEGKTHDNVVLAVHNGVTDVGTVRTDTLERMAAEGTINMNDFTIINKINDTFFFVHSTMLYPEWPLAVLPHVDTAGTKKIAKHLKLMPADSAATKAAHIVGWTYADDYTSVVQCLQDIEYGSFTKKNYE